MRLHRSTFALRRPVALAALVAALCWGGAEPRARSTPRFYSDDPIAREPETQDAARAQPWDIDLATDLLVNLFTRPGESGEARAGNVNTIDEVPDSSWFTNRIGSHPVTVDEIVVGPNAGEPPVTERWTVTGPKTAGFSPGFRLKDANGVSWFVQFDAKSQPRAATAAIAVATRLFWALGYNQVQSYLTRVDPAHLDIAPDATIQTRPGHRRPMRRSDIDLVLRRAARDPDGTYRAIAGRRLPGRVLGGFRYNGTRPDDPNDIVPHEHRRELRALKVFGAWTNLVDMKAGNTLDTLIEENGRSIVRHYLQDVGSTFGAGALGPREWDEGYEYLYEGDLVWKRLVTLGLYLRPWQTIPYRELPEIGRFEGKRFDPVAWRPRVPTAAFLHARADDNFWAALRVAAFSDELIRAAVHEGQFSDPAAEQLLGDVLIARRDRIAQAYLPAVNPLTAFALGGDGRLTFQNAAVRHGAAAAPTGGYDSAWFNYDYGTDTTSPLGDARSTAETIAAPPGLPDTAGAFVKISIKANDEAHAAWARPVDVYFRRQAAGWQLVGVDRLP